jgi:hypothetical protein
MADIPDLNSMFVKAAFIAETADGDRVVIEMHDPIRMQVRQHHKINRGDWTVETGMPMITVVGIMGRHQVWEGDMPTAPQHEIEQARGEIEHG